jgi:hypothetical protein
VYTHIINGNNFIVDTRELRSELEDLSLCDPAVIYQLTNSIRNSLIQLASAGDESEAREKSNGKINDRGSQKD